jgi:MFS family permease
MLDSGRLNHSSSILWLEPPMRSFEEVPSHVTRVVLGAGPLAAGLGFYEVAIAVFLPLEGVSITNVGAILTTFGLAAVVCSIPFSILSDRYGRKSLMFVGAFLSMPVTMVPGLTSGFFLLEISAIVGGAAEAMYISTWNAYLADATSVSTRPATFSLSFVVFTVGAGLQFSSSYLSLAALRFPRSPSDHFCCTSPLGPVDSLCCIALGG